MNRWQKQARFALILMGMALALSLTTARDKKEKQL
jgi:hypothetical protein